MSNLVLALRLSGPMQSWAESSRFNRRGTEMFPTRSAIAGICCAAKGIPRGEEKEFLERFSTLRLETYFVPRRNLLHGEKHTFLAMGRFQDFHTVLGTVTAEGKTNPNAVVTIRQYLSDASFMAFLEGNAEIIEDLGKSLINPVWGIWLGRKTCIPSEPVFAGIYGDRKEALRVTTQDLWEMKEIEVEKFSESNKRQEDIPLSFLSGARVFETRYVQIVPKQKA